MQIHRSPWAFPVLGLALVFILSGTSAFGQAVSSQEDSTRVFKLALDPIGEMPGKPSGQTMKTCFTFGTASASIPHRAAARGPNAFAWTLPDGRFSMDTGQSAGSASSQSNSGRKIHKVPLILGIAGAAVAVVGIALAVDKCGIGPCYQTGGAVAAGVGGTVAVVGFYYAFRR